MIISLLKIVDNPLQDIPLIAVLRSPIFEFTDNELIEIRLVDKSVFFFESIRKKIAQNNDDKLTIKLQDFMNKLCIWQEKANYMKLDLFIWNIYEETRYYAYVAGMPDGKRRTQNLNMLFEKAGIYEKTSLKGLFKFIKFIDRLVVSSRRHVFKQNNW